MARLSKKQLGSQGKAIMAEAKRIQKAGGTKKKKVAIPGTGKKVTADVYKKPWRSCVGQAARKLKKNQKKLF